MPDQTDSIIASALAISRTLRREMACKTGAKDVNMLQMHALLHMREHEGMTMKEIAQHLKITSPSATSFVNRLVTMGWVERSADSSNRKLVRLNVSQKGLSLLQTNLNQRKEDLRKILSLLSAKDREDLSRILSSLSTSLQHFTA